MATTEWFSSTGVMTSCSLLPSSELFSSNKPNGLLRSPVILKMVFCYRHIGLLRSAVIFGIIVKYRLNDLYDIFPTWANVV